MSPMLDAAVRFRRVRRGVLLLAAQGSEAARHGVGGIGGNRFNHRLLSEPGVAGLLPLASACSTAPVGRFSP